MQPAHPGVPTPSTVPGLEEVLRKRFLDGWMGGWADGQADKGTRAWVGDERASEWVAGWLAGRRTDSAWWGP